MLPRILFKAYKMKEKLQRRGDRRKRKEKSIKFSYMFSTFIFLISYFFFHEKNEEFENRLSFK